MIVMARVQESLSLRQNRRLQRVSRMPANQAQWIKTEYEKNDRPPVIICRDFQREFGTTIDYCDLPVFLRFHGIAERDRATVSLINKKYRMGLTNNKNK